MLGDHRLVVSLNREPQHLLPILKEHCSPEEFEDIAQGNRAERSRDQYGTH
jgi:hypothetical protein